MNKGGIPSGQFDSASWLRVATPLGARVKRFVDVIGSLLGLTLLAPVLMLVAIAVKLDSPGPIFFRQTRIGLRGAPFSLWKFRTMIHRQSSDAPAITSAPDSRITRVGNFLRKWKFDELPQLLNVLRGEMSLVGPRPEIPLYIALYRKDEMRVLDFKPGMTDPASIRYRGESALLATAKDPFGFYAETVMHDKIAMNLEYQRRATSISDLGVIFRTIAILSRGELH